MLIWLSLLVSLSLVGGKVVFKLPEKGDLVVPSQCPKQDSDRKFCGQGTSKDLSCFPRGGFVTHFKDSSNDIWHTCSKEVVCEAGLFLDNNCECTFGWNDCYHQHGCQVPRRVSLKAKKCPDETESEYCSINIRKPGCSQNSRIASLFFVIGSDGEKRWMSNPHIEHRQVMSSIEDAYLSDDTVAVPGLPSGDDLYCSYIEGRRDCHLNSSIPTRPYRIFNSNVFRQILHHEGCEEEIFCYGREMVSIYDWPKTKVETCKSCIVSCDSDRLHIVLTMESPAVIEICSPSHCKVYTTSKNVVDHMRDYVSQVSDNFFTVKAWSKAGKKALESFESRATCPMKDACEAISCFFCPENWLSVKCYTFVNWLVIILVLYATALTAMATQWVLTPFFLLVRVFLRLFRMTIKALIGLNNKCLSGVHKPTSTRQVSNLRLVRPISPPAVPLSRSQRLEEQRRQLQVPRPSALLFLIAMALLPLVTSQDCLRTRVYNFQEEECKIVDGKFVCQMETEASFNLERENVPVCLHFVSPSNAPMGKLVITLRDLLLVCEREDMYYLRDYSQMYERRTLCPGVDGCSEASCASLGPEAAVLSNPPPNPGRSFCLLGDACWTKGCFICTNSCHHIREYDHPKSDLLYTVFQCSKWSNLAEITVGWQAESANVEKVFSLKPGHEVSIDHETTMRLQFTSSFQGTSLVDQFVTDGTSFAKVTTSPAGQPIKGVIGQTQCPDKQSALTGVGCSRASDICICEPAGRTDTCTCSTINLQEVMSSKKSLPLKSGDDFFKVKNGSVVLSTLTTGSGILSLRSSRKLVGLAQIQQQCDVQLKKIDGCYNCMRGAELTYTCVTEHPMDAVLNCGPSQQGILQCDNSGAMRSLSLAMSSTMASLACEASCSSHVKYVSGTLNHVGFSRISGSTNLFVTPPSGQPGFIDNWVGFMKFGFLRWLNFILIFLLTVGLIIGFILLKKFLCFPIISLKRD